MAVADLSATTEKVRVWDLPTRIFHWTLVAAVFTAWATYEYSEALGDPTLTYHRYNGYLILILVTWRILWGIAGSETSRFASFVRWPGAVLGYTARLFTGRDRHFLGHNPLGAYGVLALLSVLAVQGVLGLMSEEHNAVTWGPLYFLTEPETRSEITDWHGTLFYYGLLVVVGLHVAGNAFHVVFKREPLVRAMVTGAKPATDYADHGTAKPALRSPALAFALLAVAAGLVFGTIKLLGGNLFY